MDKSNIFDFVLLEDFETVMPFIKKVVSLVSSTKSFYVDVVDAHCDKCDKSCIVARIVVDDICDDKVGDE